MPLFQKYLARFIATGIFTAVMAGFWDAWWHAVIGRESFWIPPHLLLYFSVVSVVTAGFYGWYKTKEKVWRNLAIVLLLVPASGPFDEIWHRIFGVESLNNLSIVWSPPHLAIIFSLIASALLVLPILSKDEDKNASNIFTAMIFASILALANFLSTPFDPLGIFQLLNFYGTSITILLFTFILLLVRKKSEEIGTSTLSAIFFLLIFSIGFSHGTSQLNPLIPAHDHAPMWLIIASVLIPSIIIDLSYKKLPYPLIGAITGLLNSSILYFIAHHFFQVQFQYGTKNALIAATSGLIGGLIAGTLITLIPKTQQSRLGRIKTFIKKLFS